MLRFFRHIRKNLLMSDKTRKYLLYAVGEILLVVIGILIALQVNNWNENRINSAEETYYLEKLIENLEADSIDIKNQLSSLADMTSSIDSALSMMVNEVEFESRKFTAHINNLLAVPIFIQNSVTFDNLISSGKIALISNEPLVNLLFQYYNPGNEHISWDEGSKHYARNIFGPYLLDIDHLDEGGLNRGLINENYSKLEKTQHTYSYYREDQKLLNYLNMKYRINTGQKQVYEITIIRLNETLNMLRSRLKELE